jgi:hypothetical protein
LLLLIEAQTSRWVVRTSIRVPACVYTRLKVRNTHAIADLTASAVPENDKASKIKINLTSQDEL